MSKEAFAPVVPLFLESGRAVFNINERRWLHPLQDTIYTTVAKFHDQCLSRVAKRLGQLTGLL